MTDSSHPDHTRWRMRAALSKRLDLVGLAVLVVVAFGAISLGYGFGFEFVCRDTFPALLCQSLSLGVPRGLCALALVGLVVVLRPALATQLTQAMRPQVAIRGVICAVLGFALILMPLLVLQVRGQVLSPLGLVTFWFGGLLLAGLGFWWALVDGRALRDHGGLRRLVPVGLAGGLGLVLPDLVLVIQPIWRIEAISDVTFTGVVQLLTLMGETVGSNLETKAVFFDDFGVFIGPQCSGVEGFALLTVFTIAFLAMSRKQVRMGRAWVLLPIAIALSWMLNVVRITVLLLIGRYISPDLAVDGFHSHAGWIVFLTLALSLALTAHKITWFHKVPAKARTRREVPPFFDDPAVAFILPFAVFMASATVTSAVSTVPAMLYPWRVGGVALALWLGRRVYLALDWRLDPLAVLAGLACGGLWLWTAPVAEPMDLMLSQRLASLAPWAMTGWIVARVVGTVVLVPVLEEAVFRGYLQQRIAALGGAFAVAWPWVGLVVSAILFGVLHDRYIAGALAGALFGLLYLRRGRLSDAIYAHAAANAVIAAAAVGQGAWHLI